MWEGGNKSKGKELTKQKRKTQHDSWVRLAKRVAGLRERERERERERTGQEHTKKLTRVTNKQKNHLPKKQTNKYIILRK